MGISDAICLPLLHALTDAFIYMIPQTKVDSVFYFKHQKVIETLFKYINTVKETTCTNVIQGIKRFFHLFSDCSPHSLLM